MLGKPQQELADQLLTCQERVRLDAEHAKEDRAEVERLRAELARAREAAPSRWALMRPCVRVRTEPDEFGSPPQWIEVRAHTWSKCGNLVVSDSLAGDGWVAVTHAPTGLRLATVFTVAEGECVLAAVEALGLDWSFEQPDAVPEEQRAAVKAAINKAAGREVRR